MPEDNEMSGDTSKIPDEENRKGPNGNGGQDSAYLDMSDEGGALGFDDVRRKAGSGPRVTLDEFLVPGRKIRKGNFKIVRKIGKGGFGSVYLAEHDIMETIRRLVLRDAIEYEDLEGVTKESIARGEMPGADAFGELHKRTGAIHPSLVSPWVAIKFLDPSLIVGDKQDDPTNYIRRLRLEAGFMEHFSHPNVIKGLGRKGTSFWPERDPRTGKPMFYAFAMEYAQDSVSLDCIDDLTSKETFKIMDQIFSGVWHTHDKGAVWRDAAPKNMLYNRQTGKAWCTDFGISRPMTTQKELGIIQDTGSGGDLSITTSGSILATPWFASPDQILQPKTVEPPSDHYSLFASWYRMVTGENPIGGVLSNPDGQKICSRVSSFDSDHAPRFPNQILKQEEARTVSQGAFQRRQVSNEIEDLMMLGLEKDVQKRLGTRKRGHLEQKIEKIRKGKLYYKVQLTPETERQALEEASRLLADARKEETAASGGNLAHMLNAAENYADAAEAMPGVLLDGSTSDFSRGDAYAKSMELYQKVVANFQIGAVGRPASKSDIEDSLHYVEAHKRLEHRRVDRLGLIKQARKKEIDKLMVSAGTRPGTFSIGRLTWGGKVDKWARAKLEAAKEFILQEKYIAARAQVNDVQQYFSQYDVSSRLSGIAHRLSVAISGTERQDQTPVEGLKSQYSTLEWLETMIGLMRKEVGRRNFNLVNGKIDGTVKTGPQGQQIREPGFRENLSDLEAKYTKMKEEARLDAPDISIGAKVEEMFKRRRQKISRIIAELEKVNQITEAEYKEFDKTFVFPMRRLEGEYSIHLDTINGGEGIDKGVFDDALARLAEIKAKVPTIKTDIISGKDCRELEGMVTGFKERTETLRKMLATSTYARAESNLQQIGEYVKTIEEDKFTKTAEMCAAILENPIAALESPLSIANIDSKYLGPDQNLEMLKRNIGDIVPRAKKLAAEVVSIKALREQKKSEDPKAKANACIGLFFANLSTSGNLQQKLEHMKHAWRHYREIDMEAATTGFNPLEFAKKRDEPGYKPTQDEMLAMQVMGLKAISQTYQMLIYGLTSENHSGFTRRTPLGLTQDMVDSYAARLGGYNQMVMSKDHSKRKLYDAPFDEELNQVCSHIEGGEATFQHIAEMRATLDESVADYDSAAANLAEFKASLPDDEDEDKNPAYLALKKEVAGYHSQKIKAGAELITANGRVKKHAIEDFTSNGVFMPSDPNDYMVLAKFFDSNDNPVLTRYFTREYQKTQPRGSPGLRESETSIITLDGRIRRTLGESHIPKDEREIAAENGGVQPGNPGEGYKGPGGEGAAPAGGSIV